MPQEKGDPRGTVKKVLRLERATGFQDRSAIDGLESLIRQILPSAVPVVSGYAVAESGERQRIVDRLLVHLTDDGGGRSDGVLEEALKAPVETARGVGAKRAGGLRKLGMDTIEDILLYFPRRIEDRTRFGRIGELRHGDEIAVRGRVHVVDQVQMGRRMKATKAAIGDGSGFLFGIWFNQPWVAQQLPRGEEIDLFGKAEFNYGEWQMRSPVWETAGTGMEIGRFVPIYPATEGITDRYLRALIDRNLDRFLPSVRDILPGAVREERGLQGRRLAIETIHRPPDLDAFEQARRSLAFEELFLLQMGLLASAGSSAGIPHAAGGTLTDSFLASLPYTLTQAQALALREIVSDLRSPRRMMRLLQGDVGSGKTIVAVLAALTVIDAGYQAVLMVPTEILAEQHALGLSEQFGGLPIRMGLLTGSTKGKAKLKDRIAAGEIDLVIGTHALIQETVSFDKLGLVIIDEQHRFGVVQRSLIEEKGDAVDLLVMSATPIPRTIALTLYGEFDVSVLDELPTGEKRIKTLRLGERERQAAYDEVARYLSEGRKGYVVLPLVEESEKIDAKAAIQAAEELSARFSGVGVGLLHGRLPSSEKAAVMEQFRSGEVQLLVSTTVIEVGIDVPDADFMVIEHADRFGLPQLHQLRGRIGRAGQPSTCLAISDARTDEARHRLEAFSEETDGFAIAEKDLAIRGPGDLLGTQQHGYLTQLRAVDLIGDLDLMRQSREDARRIHAAGTPEEITRAVERRFAEILKWLRV